MGLNLFCKSSFVCFFLSLLSYKAFAKTYSLDLSLAEKMALNKSYGKAIYEKETQKVSYGLKAKYGSLLPTLSYSFNLDYSKNSNQDGSKMTFGSGSVIRLKQTIPNPFKWGAEKSSLKLEESIARKNIQGEEFKTLESVRQKYFKIKMLENQLKNSKSNLKMVEQLKEESSSRYSTGSISSDDLKRVLIKQRQIKSRLAQHESNLATFHHEFRILLGLDGSDALDLKVDLGLSSDFLDLTKKDLEQMVAKQKNHNLVIKELLYQKSEKDAQSTSYYYVPSLSLGADYSTKQDLSFGLHLTWELFSGGSGYYKHQKDLVNKGQKYLEFLDEKDRYQIATVSKVQEILRHKEDYLVEKSILTDLEDILNASRRRFALGTLSSQDLNQDLESYINQQDIILEKTYKIIHVLSEFSTFVANETIFYPLVKNSKG